MKKILLWLVIIICLLSVPSFASEVRFIGRTGVYSSSGMLGTSLIYGVGVDYDLTDNVSLRGLVETTTYVSGGQQVTYTPISLDIIYSQRIGQFFRPYVGAGVSYNSRSSAGVSTQTTGAQAEAGIKMDVGLFTAGIEYRYMIADLKNPNLVSSTYNAYGVGTVSKSFYF